MMSEKPENRMPLSQPARPAAADPPREPAARAGVRVFDGRALEALDDGVPFFGFELLGGGALAAFAGFAGALGRFAGFAGRRGVRAESPFMTPPRTSARNADGGGHPATPVVVSYAVTP